MAVHFIIHVARELLRPAAAHDEGGVGPAEAAEREGLGVEFRQVDKFKMFPVLRYERKYFSFQLEGCNDVKYDVIFASGKDAGINKPAVIGYMFNPVKIDGEWRLCVKTANDFYDVTKQ